MKFSKEVLQHIENNLSAIRSWIGADSSLEPSNDTLVPIIAEYGPANPDINLGGSCRSCLIDMLRVAVEALKESKGEQTGSQKVKEHKDKKNDPKETNFKVKSAMGYQVGDIAKTSTNQTGKVIEILADGIRVEGILTGKLLPKEAPAS